MIEKLLSNLGRWFDQSATFLSTVPDCENDEETEKRIWEDIQSKLYERLFHQKALALKKFLTTGSPGEIFSFIKGEYKSLPETTDGEFFLQFWKDHVSISYTNEKWIIFKSEYKWCDFNLLTSDAKAVLQEPLALVFHNPNFTDEDFVKLMEVDEWTTCGLEELIIIKIKDKEEFLQKAWRKNCLSNCIVSYYSTDAAFVNEVFEESRLAANEKNKVLPFYWTYTSLLSEENTLLLWRLLNLADAKIYYNGLENYSPDLQAKIFEELESSDREVYTTHFEKFLKLKNERIITIMAERISAINISRGEDVTMHPMRRANVSGELLSAGWKLPIPWRWIIRVCSEFYDPDGGHYQHWNPLTRLLVDEMCRYVPARTLLLLSPSEAIRKNTQEYLKKIESE